MNRIVLAAWVVFGVMVAAGRAGTWRFVPSANWRYLQEHDIDFRYFLN